MGSKKRSKPFRSKWKRVTNMVEVTTSRVSKLAPDIVYGLKVSLGRAVNDITEDGLSAQAWFDLRLACVVSRRVERMGVVKGLGAIIEDAFQALESVRARSMLTDTWHHSAPSDAELSLIQEMAEMHVFQLSHLSVGEFEQVFLAARRDLDLMPPVHLLSDDERNGFGAAHTEVVR